MSHHHLVRCLPDGTSEWLSLNREGRILSGPQPGLPSSPAERTSLVLPAEQVLCLSAPRVARSPAALAQALPYAIEEQLAAPVESLHVAFDAAAAGDRVPAAVVDAEALRRRLDDLAESGLAVDACHAEWQLLPGEGSRIWLERGRVLLVDERRALCLPEADLPALGDWLRDQGFDPQALSRFRADGAAAPGEQPVDAPLATLAAQLGRRPFNLLQGSFAPRRRSQRQQTLWRLAAAFVLGALALGTALPLVERGMLERHVESRQAEMSRLLQQAVPSVTRVVDPVAQMRTALRQTGAGSDGLELLTRVAPLLAGGTRTTLDAVEYRAGTLEMTVIAADVATLDGLRERLVQQGLKAELTAANPGSQGVEGRLRISGGGA
ncbi:type II secretion system protein GspL [Pseudomarimonas salicorniae]|uniref:Type II secretion system protein L n=1 Tax=Pseudomarimonas salicorniae TaxID=2933270 RepID=A0ABT0GFG1_9GAMM|nr:type II secretion system protein GspL [Lysobacter sp. CAU 1642]MCK7592782.1 type II secretion system protein GspL [Lysobacter sp. CAU 1642]